MKRHLIAGEPNPALYPNLHAVLAGCVAGPSTNWPGVRTELRELCGALESEQERRELAEDAAGKCAHSQNSHMEKP